MAESLSLEEGDTVECEDVGQEVLAPALLDEPVGRRGRCSLRTLRCMVLVASIACIGIGAAKLHKARIAWMHTEERRRLDDQRYLESYQRNYQEATEARPVPIETQVEEHRGEHVPDFEAFFSPNDVLKEKLPNWDEFKDQAKNVLEGARPLEENLQKLDELKDQAKDVLKGVGPLEVEVTNWDELKDKAKDALKRVDIPKEGRAKWEKLMDKAEDVLNGVGPLKAAESALLREKHGSINNPSVPNSRLDEDFPVPTKDLAQTHPEIV